MRPPELLQARAAYKAGSLALDELQRLEDRMILAALEMQREVGIDVFTDGEMRRDAWQSELAAAVEGFTEEHLVFRWRNSDGGMEEEAGHIAVVGDKLRQVRRLTAHESSFMERHSPGPFKITMPSPLAARGCYKPGVTDKAYPTREEFLRDLVEIIRGEMQALVDEGVRYLQLDEGFAGYVDEGWRERLQRTGLDLNEVLDADIAAENSCYDAVPRENVTLGMHICRGNSRSRWALSGGYDWLAERVFSALHVDRFLLEYDTERAGGFEPLRFVPKGKTVVLGLLTTKHGRPEKQDDLLRRVEEASTYIPTEQLALSPQCGFASVEEGNRLSMDDQRRKLELVVETARRIWG